MVSPNKEAIVFQLLTRKFSNERFISKISPTTNCNVLKLYVLKITIFVAISSIIRFTFRHRWQI